ncbi:MAG: transcription initiation factor IIB [Nitrosopumilus sp.]
MMVEVSHQQNCKKNMVVTDFHTGEVACSNCGVVFSEKIVNQGSDVAGTILESHQDNNRTGRKISLKMADMGLSTIIESKDKDSTGKILSNKNQRMFYRLRIWDRNSRSSSSAKSFQKAFTLLDGISAKLGLPESAVEHTAYLFRKIAARKILTGRSTSDMLCALVYITCRITDTPRTLQDVAKAGNVKKKNLQRTYRFLTKELDINPETYNPIEFVTRIANSVSTSKKTEILAIKILDIAIKNNISISKNPMAMTAAAIYLAVLINKEKVSQTKISSASGISSVTIRDRVKEIKEKIGGEING